MANTIRLKRGTTEPVAGDLVTGELAINTTDASVYTKLDDGTVSPVVGKSNNLFVTVRNETGVAIPAGSAVYISGASNGKPLITLAQANAEATSSKTLGLTVASISHNNNGSVIAEGLLTKIDTQSYTAGNGLWLSASVAGGLTTTPPSAPNHAVFIGTVLLSANNGKIEVKVQNGYELQELHNVSLTSPTNGQALTYNSSTGLWVNSTVSASAAWGGITGTLSSQTDLNTALGLKANLASPTFTGTPAAPTASAGTNTTQVATTAFVTTAISTKANLASPALTGTPTAPTATTATNTTQIATTAYVKSNLASYVTYSTLSATLGGYATTGQLNSYYISTPLQTQIGDIYVYAASAQNSIILINTEGATSHNVYFQPDVDDGGMAVGTQVVFVQMDSYSAVFSAVSGATLYSRGSRFVMNGQYAVATAVKVAGGTWVLSGDLV